MSDFKTLLLTCVDHRIDPKAPLLCSALGRGKVWVLRNVGNVACCEEGEISVLAALEFACHVVEVERIVVCGHSDCGAIRARATKKIPQGSLHRWLSAIDIKVGEGDLDVLSREHALAQKKKVENVDCVKSADVEVLCWWLDLKTQDLIHL